MIRLAAFPKCFMDELCVTHTMSLFDWIALASTLGVEGLEMHPGFFTSLDRAYLQEASVSRNASVGPLVRTVTVGRDPLAVAIPVHPGRIFVTNSGSNTVSVLDVRSGTVLRTIPVGVRPTGIVPLTDHPLTATTGNAHNVYIGGV